MDLSQEQRRMIGRRHVLAGGAVAMALAVFGPRMAAAQDIDADFFRYTGSFVALTSMLAWQSTEVGRLTTTSTEADYVNEGWRIDVLSPFSISQAAQVVMAGLTPPTVFIDTHQYFSDAIDELVQAGTYFRGALLNLDPSLLDLALVSINRSNELITLATAAIPGAALVP